MSNQGDRNWSLFVCPVCFIMFLILCSACRACGEWREREGTKTRFFYVVDLGIKHFKISQSGLLATCVITKNRHLPSPNRTRKLAVHFLVIKPLFHSKLPLKIEVMNSTPVGRTNFLLCASSANLYVYCAKTSVEIRDMLYFQSEKCHSTSFTMLLLLFIVLSFFSIRMPPLQLPLLNCCC